MSRVRIGFFRGSWSSRDSAGSTVITNVAFPVDAHSFVISVAEVLAAEIIHRRVVAEAIVAPVAAFVPGATVAVSIIHAAVKTDLVAPVPAIPGVRAIVPAPIARSPEQALAGWLNPCARHPEVALVAIGPVARRPEIALLRADRLRVNDQFRRRDRNGGAELRAGRHWHRQNYKCEKKISN